MKEASFEKNQKKILQIITTSKWGGAQRVCYDLAVNLAKRGFHVDVACAPGGLLVDKLSRRNIRVYTTPFLKEYVSVFNDLKTIYFLYSLIKNKRYQIVHCHSTKAGVLGRIAARMAKTPKIYFTVHGWSFYRWERKKSIKYRLAKKIAIIIERIVGKFTHKIVCVSESDKNEGLKNKIAPESKFLIIKNGINFVVQNSNRKFSNTIKIGSVARASYQKRPDLFFKIAKQLLREYESLQFIWIGGGVLLKEFKKLIKENKLQNKILAVGQKSTKEVKKLLSTFDIFVLTSQWEGLPIALIEAMFARKPIVAFDVGGVKELVKDGFNGYLIPFENLALFKEKLVTLILNSELRKKMGENGYKFAKKNFTLERMINKYQRLYLENSS